jgi:hypothetical protein
MVLFRVGGGYSISGGIDHESQRTYPIVRGPDAAASLQVKVDARNTLATTANLQLAYREDGTDSGYLNATENYTHLFSRQTTFTASAGLSLSEDTPPGGLTLYGVYPTGGLSITHTERLARGRLSLMAMVNSMPVLDLYTGTIDPRLGTYATVGWTRDRFAIAATVNSSVSIAQEKANAFNAFYANLTMRYKIGGGFSLDAGVNTAWEKYANQQSALVPASAVFIVGLSWAAIQPIVAPPHQRRLKTL